MIIFYLHNHQMFTLKKLIVYIYIKKFTLMVIFKQKYLSRFYNFISLFIYFFTKSAYLVTYE